MLAWASALLLLWALGVAGAAGIAAARARRRFGGAPVSGTGHRGADPAEAVASAAPTAPVELLRPCAGDEDGLEARLVATAAARGAFRLTVLVADPGDPGRAAAERACATLRARGHAARVVVTFAPGPNRKAAQLATVLDAAGAGDAPLACVDSDVDLTGFDLAALLAPFANPRVGATWAPPVEAAPARTLGDRASQALLGASLHAFPLLAGLDPGGMVGKVFAVRPAALGAAGGFGRLATVLGEDMALARSLRAAGYRVAMVPEVARSMAGGRSLKESVARLARWLFVIRAQRPGRLAGYPGLFLAPALIALAAAIVVPAGLAGGAPLAAAVAGLAALVAAAARLGVARLGGRLAGRPRGLLATAVDAVLADTLLGLAFVRVLGRRRVVWRGRVLTLDRAGGLHGAP